MECVKPDCNGCLCSTSQRPPCGHCETGHVNLGEVHPDLDAWISNEKHLPEFLRDFHDQKDFFKTLSLQYGPLPDGMSWVTAHIFTIDFLLRFLAYRGFKIQRSRSKQMYLDLDTDIQERRNQEAKVLQNLGIK